MIPSMLTTDQYSEVGTRSTNQDRQLVTSQNGVHCIIVADGVGGTPGGAEASAIAVDALVRQFKAKPAVGRDILVAMFHQAHIAVKDFQKTNPDQENAETTAVVLLVDEIPRGIWRASWGHVGDSRLYVLRDGSTESVTRDHSLASLENTLYSRKSNDRDNPDASKLMQVIGGQREPTPEISDTVDAQPGDRFLLCTDGFWRAISKADIERSSAASTSATEWLTTMRKALSPNHLTDNHSAVVVQLSGTPKRLPTSQPSRGVFSDSTALRRMVFAQGFVIILILCFGAIKIPKMIRGKSHNIEDLALELKDEQAQIVVLEKQLRESRSQLQSLRVATEHAPPTIDLFNVKSTSSARDRDDWLVEWDVSDADTVELYIAGERVSKDAEGSIHRILKTPTTVRISATAGTHTIEKERLVTPLAPLLGHTVVKGDDQKQ